MIFQEPMTSLDPVFTIGDQIAETAALHLGLNRTEAMKRALDMLELVEIPAASSASTNIRISCPAGCGNG